MAQEPLLFLIFINDLPEDITSICKIFADDTFLLSKVQDINKFVNELYCYLGKAIGHITGKYNLTPYAIKQANEGLFS